jgi:hypothetical protein
MNTTTKDIENLNEDYYTDLVTAKTISIPVNKLKEFITLLYGEREFIIETQQKAFTNFIDLRENNLIFV